MKIQIENLEIAIDAFKLTVKEMNIKSGEYVYILGPTGSGKTVFLEILAGFLSPDEGRIYFEGKNVINIPPEKRNIGFMYQNYHLFPHLNVRKNIEFGTRMRNNYDKDFINYLCEKLGIIKLLNRKVQKLSGGEKQRVALARALAIKPSLLLLDEPLSAVDAHTKNEILKLLHELNQEYNLTTIHVTHDEKEIINNSPVYIIKDGELKKRCLNVQAHNNIY